MSLIHYTGLNGLNLATDRGVLRSGAATYDTSVPAKSYASRSLSLTVGAVTFPWLTGDTQSEPATGVWLHFRLYLAANNNDNDQIRVGVSRNNTDMISISVEDITSLPTLRIGAAVVATASVGNEVTATTWAGNRYLLEVEGYLVGDRIRLYPDGDSGLGTVINYVLTAGNAATLAGIGLPNETKIESVAGTGLKVTDLVAMDINDGIGSVDPAIFTDITIKGAVFVSDDPVAEWDGDSSDIDELPHSDPTLDEDVLSSDTVGQESKFGRNNLQGSTLNVYSMRFLATSYAYGTAGGSMVGVSADDGSVQENAATAALDVTVYHHVPPSGGSWTPATIDGTDISLFSRA